MLEMMLAGQTVAPDPITDDFTVYSNGSQPTSYFDGATPVTYYEDPYASIEVASDRLHLSTTPTTYSYETAQVVVDIGNAFPGNKGISFLYDFVRGGVGGSGSYSADLLGGVTASSGLAHGSGTITISEGVSTLEFEAESDSYGHTADLYIYEITIYVESPL